ncbi:MAG: hypothetical protein J0L96_10065 [Anaerolineae bacterium]|nr:hypothetical protein [Anaerolineae bacterium]
MQNEPPEFDDENDEEEINVEEWLFALMAMTGNKAGMDELVRKISTKTGQSLDEVEKIITATIQELAKRSRTNLN